MRINAVFILLIVANLLIFLLGNVVYSDLVSIPLLAKILISELCFIVLYSLTDYANARFGVIFAFCYIPLLAVGYLTIFSPIFYSYSVQLFSITIAIFGSIINFSIFRVLYKKLKAVLLSSRISTVTTSVLEASLFSYLLDIGLVGFATTLAVRFVYVYIVPKLILGNKNIAVAYK